MLNSAVQQGEDVLDLRHYNIVIEHSPLFIRHIMILLLHHVNLLLCD